ncbi:hypothetical protein BaRGS_00031501 [Batillaria attramentaria]|uniref:Uncharacterized protein n=1 Tax=Batillaria attramentaria TaxID=370345 RepID=A0ABD0JRV2_9CAEN
MRGHGQLLSETITKSETSKSATLGSQKMRCMDRDFTLDYEVTDKLAFVSAYGVKLFLERGKPPRTNSTNQNGVKNSLTSLAKIVKMADGHVIARQ